MDMFMTLFYARLRNKLPSIGDMGDMNNPSWGGNSPTQAVVTDGIISSNMVYDDATGIISGKMSIEDGIVIL